MKCMYEKDRTCDDSCKGLIPKDKTWLKNEGFVCYRQIHSTSDLSLF